MKLGNRKSVFLGAAILFLLFPDSAKAASIHAGPGSFIFSFAQGNQLKPIRVWTFGPPRISQETKILFVMHGRERNAHGYLNPWMAPAHKANALLLAPEFSEQVFPGRSYNVGELGFLAGQGALVGRSTFEAIEMIFDHVVGMTGLKTRRYRIYGHSAGAQFVHRLILLNPNARAEVAVAANAGWYTMPDFQSEFPYGLKDSGVTPRALAQALRKKLIVLLGEKDNDPRHSSLNRQPGAMSEGVTRLERGQNFYRRAEAEAHALGIRLAWELKTVAGVGHDHSAMSDEAAPLLFESLSEK